MYLYGTMRDAYIYYGIDLDNAKKYDEYKICDKGECVVCFR